MTPDQRIAEWRAKGLVIEDRGPGVLRSLLEAVGAPPLPEPGRALFTAELPYPPTVNTYWRSVVIGAGRRAKVRLLISRRGREYQRAVKSAVVVWEPLLGPLYFDATVHPPDRRRRDLDNVTKALLDSLGKAGVYGDDSQIQAIALRWGGVVPGGLVRVTISERTYA